MRVVDKCVSLSPLLRETGKNLLDKKYVKGTTGNCLGPSSNHHFNVAMMIAATVQTTRHSALTAVGYSDVCFLCLKVLTPGSLAPPSLRSPANKCSKQADIMPLVLHSIGHTKLFLHQQFITFYTFCMRLLTLYFKRGPKGGKIPC